MHVGVLRSAPRGLVAEVWLDASGGYALTDSAGGRFSINSTTGVVTVANTLDAETATSHNITVKATSDDGSVEQWGDRAKMRRAYGSQFLPLLCCPRATLWTCYVGNRSKTPVCE